MNQVIDGSELDDFRNILLERSLDPDQFEVTELSDASAHRGVFPVTGSVHVANKATGKARRYQAGHGTSWASEFDRDLAADAFS